jgi:hypothetical protein
MYCDGCGQIKQIPNATAWADVSRVHALPIYSYDRKVQFKETILLYQGKCIKIDLSILKKIILSPNMTKIEFFYALKNVTKVRTYFDHVHALYYHAFNKKPPNLTKIENKLLADFEKFTLEYSNTFKNCSISNSFLIYQFLNRYGIPTSKDDVLLMDSLDNLVYKQCQTVFIKLGWEIFDV